jgi:hypothetical protein
MATNRWTDADRGRLTALMDKLTAVTMDLKPLCSPSSSMKPPPVESTVEAACKLMHTAIDDLRAVIERIDEMSGGGHVMPPS